MQKLLIKTNNFQHRIKVRIKYFNKKPKDITNPLF